MRDYLTITLQLWSSGYNIQYTVYRADTRHGNMNAGHLSTDTWAAASEDGEYGVSTGYSEEKKTIIHIST